MTTILSTFPGAGFNVMVGPGNIYSGGAVAFIPSQDCNMISVTLGLKGYTAQMVPHFALQLLADVNGKPADAGLPHFTKPAPNDGSLEEFTFVLESKAALKAGQTYWVLAYGGTTAQPYTPVGSNWVAGSAPAGTAQFKKSFGFRMGDFIPSTEIPVFRIDVE